MSDTAMVPKRSMAIGERGIAPENAAQLMDMAKWIAASDLKPAGIKTPADAFLVMAVGMSWGYDPIMALQVLHVVKGRVGLPGETCAALIQSHPLCADYRWGFEGDGDDRYAWIQTIRKGRPGPNPRSTFSVRDAKVAGLWESKTRNGEKTPWWFYPDDMIMWKAVAREKRRNWPDIYPGLRVAEDLEPHDVGEVNVTQTKRAPERDPLLEGATAPPAPVVDAEYRDGVEDSTREVEREALETIARMNAKIADDGQWPEEMSPVGGETEKTPEQEAETATQESSEAPVHSSPHPAPVVDVPVVVPLNNKHGCKGCDRHRRMLEDPAIGHGPGCRWSALPLPDAIEIR